MPGSNGKWRRHNRDKPCPICEKTDRCTYTKDGAHRCFRAEAAAGWVRVKTCTDGTGVFVTAAEAAKREEARQAKASKRSKRSKSDGKRSSIDWAAQSARFTRAITDARLTDLAVILGVTNESLRRLECGWASQEDLRRIGASGQGWEQDYPDGAWTFPEKDAAGAVIGLSLRTRDGRKGSPKGANRGLIIPKGFDPKMAVVPIVEGASDVAAFLSTGIMAVEGA